MSDPGNQARIDDSGPFMSKRTVQFVEVGHDQNGRRLDNFLTSLLGNLPKSFIYKIIRRGEVRVNGARAKPDSKLRAADVVRVPPMRVAESGPLELSEAKLQLIRDAVLYEDEAMLLINKPAGLAVHAGSGLRFGVIDLVRAMRPDTGGIELVHRLDRDTSGCLIFAKRYPGLRQLQAQLGSPGSHKTYLALLEGHLPLPTQEVDLRLRTTRYGGEKRTEVDPDGKTAFTRFSVLEEFPGFTLAEVEITSGRTHQIRVHAAAVGHPVAGDKKYGDITSAAEHRARGLKRMFLHAASVTLRSPARDRAQKFSAALPADLARYLERARCLPSD